MALVCLFQSEQEAYCDIVRETVNDYLNVTNVFVFFLKTFITFAYEYY